MQERRAHYHTAESGEVQAEKDQGQDGLITISALRQEMRMDLESGGCGLRGLSARYADRQKSRGPQLHMRANA